MKHKGSCLCGAVTFEVTGEFESFYLCHCERCRKDTGSAHASNLFSTTASIKWLSGKEKITTYDFKGEGHIKSFCSICGSAVPNIQLSGALLAVPAGSLDTDPIKRPDAHIYYSHKAQWDDGFQEIDKFDELPEK